MASEAHREKSEKRVRRVSGGKKQERRKELDFHDNYIVIGRW